MPPNNTIQVNIQVNLKGIQAFTQFGRAIGDMGKANAGFGNTAKATAAAATGMARFGRATAGVQRPLNSLVTRLSGIERAMDPIFRAGFRMQMVGNDLENLGRRGFQAIQGLMDQFGTFEFMLNRVSGAMGVTTTGSNVLSTSTGELGTMYQHLEESVKDAADAAILFPYADVAKATYFWASTTGQQVKTTDDLRVAMEGVIPLMKVAAMTETNYETAIKGVYSILTQYGKGLEDTAEVTAILHLVTQRTAAEFPDLVNSFKMVGPVARELGVSFEEVAITFGRLADAGIRGTMSGRALRQFFIQTVRPAEKAKDAIEDLFGGLDYMSIITNKTTGEFIGLTAWVNKLAERTKNLNATERVALLARITTANELPVLTALVSKQVAVLRGTSKGWKDYGDETTIARVAAEGFNRSWATLQDSWQGVVNSFARGAERIQMTVGRIFSEVLSPPIRELTKGLGELAKWVDKNQAIVALAGKMAIVASAGLILVGVLFQILGGLTSMGAALANAVVGFGPLFAKFVFFGGLVGTIVTAAIRNWGMLVKTFEAARNTIMEAFDDAGVSGQDFSDLMTEVMDIARVFGDTVIEVFAGTVKVLADFAAAVIKNKPVAGIIAAIAKALALLLALKWAAQILMLGKAFGILRAALSVPFVLIQRMAVVVDAYVASTVVAGKATASMAGALRALGVAALGPIAWIAAIGVALAAMTPEGQGFIAALIDDFRDLKGELRDLRDEFGNLADDIEAAAIRSINATTDLDDRMADLLRRKSMGQTEVDSMFGPIPWHITIDTAIGDVQGQIDRQMIKFAEMVKKRSRSISEAFDLDLDPAAYAGKVKEFMGALNIDDFDLGSDIVDSFYQQFQDGLPKTEYAIERWYKGMAVALAVQGKKMPFSLNLLKDLTWDPEAAYEAGRKLAQESNDKIAEGYLNQLPRLFAGGPAQVEQGNKLLSILTDWMTTGDIRSDLADRTKRFTEGLTNAQQEAFLAGLEEFDPAKAAAAAKEQSESLINAIVGSWTTLKDWPNRIKEMLKATPTHKAIVVEAFKQFTSGALRDAINSSHPDMVEASKLWMADISATVTASFDAGSASQKQRILDRFVKLFKEGIPQSLPQEAQTNIAKMFSDMYTKLGQPVPDWVATELKESVSGTIDAATAAGDKAVKKFSERSAEWRITMRKHGSTLPMPKPEDVKPIILPTATYPTVSQERAAAGPWQQALKEQGKQGVVEFTRGIKTEQQKAALAAIAVRSAAFDGLRGIAVGGGGSGVGGKTAGMGSPFIWGQNMVKEFVRGLRSLIGWAQEAARDLAKAVTKFMPASSPAEEGPMSTLNEWGPNIGKALVKGMDSSRASVRLAALRLADEMAMASGNGMNIMSEHSSRKEITLNVKVTSPDGSVDKLKAAQIQSAIQKSSVWDELQHLVTVG